MLALFSRPKRKPAGNVPRRSRLTLELLETRDCPASPTINLTANKSPRLPQARLCLPAPAVEQRVAQRHIRTFRGERPPAELHRQKRPGKMRLCRDLQEMNPEGACTALALLWEGL
jgi:hypothetical protein